MVINTQKCLYLIRPIAHLYISPIFDNGLYENIQGEMQEIASYTSTKPSSLIESFFLVVL